MIQSLGIAMREQLVYDGQQLANGSILAYRVPEFSDLPDEIRTFVVENRDGMGPWGSKAHGDGSMAVVVPAIANALHDALGIRMHRAPFTPERVWRALANPNAGDVIKDAGGLRKLRVSDAQPTSASRSRLR